MATATQKHQRELNKQKPEIALLKKIIDDTRKTAETRRMQIYRHQVRIRELVSENKNQAREIVRLNRRIYEMETGKKATETIARESKINNHDREFPEWLPEIDSPIWKREMKGHQTTDSHA